MTTYFDNFLKTNQAYADLHGTAHLPIKPKTKVAIVTCMDSRLHVAQALGLALGDAHILRNAGGRVTDDVLRSLVISQQQLGTREIVIQIVEHRRLLTKLLLLNYREIWVLICMDMIFFLLMILKKAFVKMWQNYMLLH